MSQTSSGQAAGRPEPDRRIARTRQSLWEALVALIDERGYAALAVSDITSRAGVNRTTFYRHFEDKDDLFRQGCMDFIEGLIDRIRGNFSISPDQDLSWMPAYLAGLFAHIEAEKHTFRILSGPRGNPEFLRITQDLVCDFLVNERLKDWSALVRHPDSPNLPTLYARAVTSLLVGLSSWWLHSDQAISAEDIGLVYSTLVTHGVTGLLQLRI